MVKIKSLLSDNFKCLKVHGELQIGKGLGNQSEAQRCHTRDSSTRDRNQQRSTTACVGGGLIVVFQSACLPTQAPVSELLASKAAKPNRNRKRLSTTTILLLVSSLFALAGVRHICHIQCIHGASNKLTDNQQTYRRAEPLSIY